MQAMSYLCQYYTAICDATAVQFESGYEFDVTVCWCVSMFHTEREGDRHFIKQELEACVESTNKLAAEERRQHFEYVDVASVNKDTDDVSTDEPGGPSSSQIVKEEIEDELSVHEDECLWSLKTSR